MSKYSFIFLYTTENISQKCRDALFNFLNDKRLRDSRSINEGTTCSNELEDKTSELSELGIKIRAVDETAYAFTSDSENNLSQAYHILLDVLKIYFSAKPNYSNKNKTIYFSIWPCLSEPQKEGVWYFKD